MIAWPCAVVPGKLAAEHVPPTPLQTVVHDCPFNPIIHATGGAETEAVCDFVCEYDTLGICDAVWVAVGARHGQTRGPLA